MFNAFAVGILGDNAVVPAAVFQIIYPYAARKPSVTEQISVMIFIGVGIASER